MSMSSSVVRNQSVFSCWIHDGRHRVQGYWSRDTLSLDSSCGVLCHEHNSSCIRRKIKDEVIHKDW